MRRYRLSIPRDDISNEIVPRNELVFDTSRNRLVMGDGVSQGNNLPELNPLFSSAIFTTTDATPVDVIVIDVPDNSAGIIELKMIAAAQDISGVLVGIKHYAYQKVSGSLLISSPVVVMADTKINWSSVSPSWVGAETSGVFTARVTGAASTTIFWKVNWKIVSAVCDFVLP